MSTLQFVASRSGSTEAKVYQNQDRRSQRLTLRLRDPDWGSTPETRQKAWLEKAFSVRAGEIL